MLEARKTILCIEDDRETAALIAEELVEQGFAVDVVHNGQEGLADSPRTLLVPFMSGFDVLERLTEIAPGFGYMPFVFLTALTDRENELKGRQLGADDFVRKPVDFDVLVAIVNMRLARALRNDTWLESGRLERARSRDAHLGRARKNLRRDRANSRSHQADR